MATSQSSQTDWAQFYGPTATDSIAVSTGPNQSEPVHNIEGRVGKSGRRRSRSSRRAPTTLLSTDPTNFRAMVQQFTGAPPGPSLNRTGPEVNFGYRSNLGQPPVQYQQVLQQLQNQGQVYSNTQEGVIGNKEFDQGFNFVGNDSSSNGVFLDGMGGGYANQMTGGYFL